MIEPLEATLRTLGLAGLITALVASGSHAVRSRDRPTGRSSGLARTLGALPTYLLAAIPYCIVWMLLWRDISARPPDWLHVVVLLAGGLLGATGWAIYLWGRISLGAMYNVSSVLGAELYADQRLITTGPFRHVRHPMYVGIALAAVGGLLIYRTWALVFAVAALPAFVVKARHEERLLAAEFGAQWVDYCNRVSAWWPRVARKAPASAVNGKGEERD